MRQSIFDIPELVQLVQAYLPPRDAARLARSNRKLFFTAMPPLWERVEDLLQLIRLLLALGDINYKNMRQFFK
ncbi:hypothetical protein FS749_015181, partial [Ceratobasidium sp. UAMH 11750]